MATVPEFISVLRRIRDVIYPKINELYDNSLILKESIDVGKAEFDADLVKFNTDYSDFNTKKSQVDASVLSASQSASSASQSALTATNKSNEIKAITAQSTTGAPGTSASASYNPTDGKFTFAIPQGSKGDKGESFTVNSSGLTAQRALYDAQPAGWSFLDITTSTLYFKASNTSGDWSSGVPFGKGDKGDTGDTGVGIESFTFVSTTDSSGLAGKSGATDTYRVTLTNTNTFDYVVYNGLDADDSLVLHKDLDENVIGAKTFENDKLKVKALDNKISTIKLENGATSNINLIIPKEGGKIAVVDSPTFIGTPTAPTQSPQDNSTKVATTAYVDGKFVRSTAITAGGTSIDFTGIPSWAKRIHIALNGISTNGTSQIQIQIGAGTIKNTGYLSYGNGISNSATGGGAVATSGYVIDPGGIISPSSTTARYGTIMLENITGNSWNENSSIISYNGSSYISCISGGNTTLLDSLDRVRITTVNGTDTFDAGQINITYEG